MGVWDGAGSRSSTLLKGLGKFWSTRRSLSFVRQGKARPRIPRHQRTDCSPQPRLLPAYGYRAVSDTLPQPAGYITVTHPPPLSL